MYLLFEIISLFQIYKKAFVCFLLLYISICLSSSLFLCPSLSLPWLSLCLVITPSSSSLSPSTALSLSLPFSICFSLPDSISRHMFLCQSVCLSLSLSLSLWLSLSLSLSLCISASVSLYVYLPLYVSLSFSSPWSFILLFLLSVVYVLSLFTCNWISLDPNSWKISIKYSTCFQKMAQKVNMSVNLFSGYFSHSAKRSTFSSYLLIEDKALLEGLLIYRWAPKKVWNVF